MTEAYALRLAEAAEAERCRVADEDLRDALSARAELLRSLAAVARFESAARIVARERYQKAREIAIESMNNYQ